MLARSVYILLSSLNISVEFVILIVCMRLETSGALTAFHVPKFFADSSRCFKIKMKEM